MKKFTRIFLCLVLFMGLICSPVTIPQMANTTIVDEAEAATIKLNKKEVKLYKGDSYQLKVKGTKKVVKWKSSKPGVATVKKGKVVAKKIGTTTITAKVAGKTLKCKVKVCSAPKMNVKSKTLVIGQSTTLSVKNAIKTVKWSSSNTSVATVKGGTVTAMGHGTATITAKVGNKKATCKIVVRESFAVDIPSVMFTNENDSQTVKITYYGTGTISQKSNNTSVATAKWEGSFVDNSVDLRISPKGEGTTTIVVTNELNRDKIEIEVVVDLPNPEDNLKITVKNPVPNVFHDRDYSGDIDQIYTLKDVRYEVTYHKYDDDYTVKVYFTGTKDFDARGSGYSQMIPIGWKLYDAEGYVIESSTTYSSALKMGESFRDAQGYIFDLKAGNYTLEISDTQ